MRENEREGMREAEGGKERIRNPDRIREGGYKRGKDRNTETVLKPKGPEQETRERRATGDSLRSPDNQLTALPRVPTFAHIGK